MVAEPQLFLTDEQLAEILEFVPSYYAKAIGPFGANFTVKYMRVPNIEGVVEIMEEHKKNFDNSREMEYDPDQWHVLIGHQNFN